MCWGDWLEWHHQSQQSRPCQQNFHWKFGNWLQATALLKSYGIGCSEWWVCNMQLWAAWCTQNQDRMTWWFILDWMLDYALLFMDWISLRQKAKLTPTKDCRRLLWMAKDRTPGTQVVAFLAVGESHNKTCREADEPSNVFFSYNIANGRAKSGSNFCLQCS